MRMQGKVFQVSPDGRCELHEVNVDSNDFYNILRSLTESEVIEVVSTTNYLKKPYVIIIDEEGRLKEKQMLNLLGTMFYTNDITTESPIVDTMVIAKLADTQEGLDIVPLNEADIELVEKAIKDASEVMDKEFEIAHQLACIAIVGVVNMLDFEKITDLIHCLHNAELAKYMRANRAKYHKYLKMSVPLRQAIIEAVANDLGRVFNKTLQREEDKKAQRGKH